MRVAAARTKPLKKPQAKKQAGAKATKKMERLVSKGFELEPAEATMFRALSARELLEPRQAGHQLCRKGTLSGICHSKQELVPEVEATCEVSMRLT